MLKRENETRHVTLLICTNAEMRKVIKRRNEKTLL